jgi:hypothetical protein
MPCWPASGPALRSEMELIRHEWAALFARAEDGRIGRAGFRTERAALCGGWRALRREWAAAGLSHPTATAPTPAPAAADPPAAGADGVGPQWLAKREDVRERLIRSEEQLPMASPGENNRKPGLTPKSPKV